MEGALSTIPSSQKLIPGDFNFFKAYCLYCEKKLDKALEILKGQERNAETILLECQILYHQGKMDACFDVSQKLLKSKIENLEINLVACLILAWRSSEVQKILEAHRIEVSSSYELVYNTACSFIEQNQYMDVEQLLLTSRG